MSLANSTETDVRDMLLKGTDPSWRVGTNRYLALVSDALNAVSEATPLANELSFVGYARVAIPTATGFNSSGQNAAQVKFNKQTSVGSVDVNHFVLVDTASGPANFAWIGTLDDPVTASLNVSIVFEPTELNFVVE